MDIIPTAKFQESLSKVTLSLHCSYLKNQIISSINQILPKVVASKLYMSDVDLPLNNEILNRLIVNNCTIILRPKDIRYQEAIDLLGINYRSGKIYVLPHRARRMEMALLVMIQRSDENEGQIIKSFNEFMGKALGNFDSILERVTNFKTKCLETERVLTKSVSVSDKNLAHRVLQLMSEIADDEPPMIYHQLMLLILKMTKADSGVFGIFNSYSGEIKIYVNGTTLKEEPSIYTIKNKHSLYDTINLNATVIFKAVDITHKHKHAFQQLVDGYTKPIVTAMISVSLVKMTLGLKCVVLLLNKVSKDISFTRNDSDFVNNALMYATPIIHMANNLQIERLERNRTQKLLIVAKNIFSHMDNFDELIANIMKEAKALTESEGSSLFLLDEEKNELVSKVLDGESKLGFRTEIRFPITHGIAGLVAKTGKLLNIKNAHDHPAFSRSVDEIHGFSTKSILCFPIQNDKGKIVGVAQLCNKINFPYFNAYDEDVAVAFSVFCHISIINSLIYKKIEDAQQRSVLANKVMTSNSKARDKISLNLIEKISQSTIVQVEEILNDATSITSLPKSVHERDTIMFSMAMFERLDFINRWRIHRRSLAIFLLSVKRGYRDVPYHNWYHAVSVGHFIFASIISFKLNKYLQEIESFVLFVAGFCHDIDHRGTNNSFQTKTKSVLASLYSSEGSMLEQHHFAQTVCILQSESSNIFESMDHKQYLNALDLLRYIILATDLVHHFKKKPELDKLALRPYKFNSLKDRTMMLCILISSADLSDQIKVWPSAVESSKAIILEFLRQGDMEKDLGNVPLDYMDRDKVNIPNMQVAFLEGVVLPLYITLSKIFSQAQKALDNIKSNLAKWKELCDMVQLGRISGLNESIFDFIENKLSF